MSVLARFSLFRQLLAGGAVALFVGMLVVGSWISREIETAVVHRTGVTTALFVDSYVSGSLDALAHGGRLTEADEDRLNRLLEGTPLGRQIVSMKVWSPEGRILYSSNPSLTGRQFRVKPALAAALAGEVRSELSHLTDEENAPERELWSVLIETYTPLRASNGGLVVAVTEFHQVADDLLSELQSARVRSWIMVVAATMVMLALFAILVRRANDTIVAQQAQLTEKVSQLTGLLAQNEQLNERVTRAASRTAALNERFLHRIAADLHDGAGQGLALALMRMETLAEACSSCNARIANDGTVRDEFRRLREALRASLEDLRSISKGLHLPQMEDLSIGETARRAIRDYERNSGVNVTLTLENAPDEAPIAQKIALFRLLQESLANGFRHGGGVNQCVTVHGNERTLRVEVRDDGKGFDPDATAVDGHLGLQGMRERVEILGGSFDVRSSDGHGTLIIADLPLTAAEVEHG